MKSAILKETKNRETLSGLLRNAIANSLTQEILSKASSPDCVKSFSKYLGNVSEIFSRCELTIEDIAVRGDRVMVRYKLQSKPADSYLGVAAGNKTITISSLDVFRLKDAKIVEHWDTVYQINAF